MPIRRDNLCATAFIGRVYPTPKRDSGNWAIAYAADGALKKNVAQKINTVFIINSHRKWFFGLSTVFILYSLSWVTNMMSGIILVRRETGRNCKRSKIMRTPSSCSIMNHDFKHSFFDCPFSIIVQEVWEFPMVCPSKMCSTPSGFNFNNKIPISINTVSECPEVVAGFRHASLTLRSKPQR